MKKFIINGKFLCDEMQSFRRLLELIKSMDKNMNPESLDITLVIPEEVQLPEFKNIKVKILPGKRGILWELIDLRKYVNNSSGSILFNFCNIAPFFTNPGITIIHDITYKVFPENYKTLRNRLSRIWHCLQYSYVSKHEKLIFTMSNFTSDELIRFYPAAKGKTFVIGNGWQQIHNSSLNSNWGEKYPFLEKNNYFFSLSQMARHKNFKWIIEVAKRNKNATFAVAGKLYEENINDIPGNVYLLGFISDEDAFGLMKDAKAFIFPSLYEGFGIPPLEALALGTEVIASNKPPMPEVLGNSVHYIDPDNYDVDLDTILNDNTDRIALDKWNWDNIAKDICLKLETL